MSKKEEELDTRLQGLVDKGLVELFYDYDEDGNYVQFARLTKEGIRVADTLQEEDSFYDKEIN